MHRLLSSTYISLSTICFCVLSTLFHCVKRPNLWNFIGDAGTCRRSCCSGGAGWVQRRRVGQASKREKAERNIEVDRDCYGYINDVCCFTIVFASAEYRNMTNVWGMTRECRNDKGKCKVVSCSDAMYIRMHPFMLSSRVALTFAHSLTMQMKALTEKAKCSNWDQSLQPTPRTSPYNPRSSQPILPFPFQFHLNVCPLPEIYNLSTS